MRCPICNCSNISTAQFPFPPFRHPTYTPCLESAQAIAHQCNNCQLIFSGIDPAEIEQIYTSPEYTKTMVTGLEMPTEAGVTTPHAVWAHEIESSLTTNTPRVLDIGCFDGKMLAELRKIFKHAELVGYDVAPGVNELFPLGSDILFVEKLSAATGKFDVISIADALPFIPDLPGLFCKIKGMLKSDGKLFIFTPDVEKNKALTLLNDSLYAFSPESIDNALKLFGFSFEEIGFGDIFSRHVGGFARVCDDLTRHKAQGTRHKAQHTWRALLNI